MNRRTYILSLLALASIGIAGRLLPHAWNTTPIAAIALLTTSYIGLRSSIAVSMAVMAISDAFIGLYNWRVMASVYGSIILATAIGISLRRAKSPQRALFCAASSSLLFFLITNWAVWQFGSMYDRSLQGLLDSYVMGIPFFRNAFIGDIFYTFAFFGTFEAFRRTAFFHKKLGAPA